MRASEILEILDGEIFNDRGEDPEVECGCGCDLMSDVLAFVHSNTVLITGAVNPQVIRTCEVVDIHCVVFVRGKQPAEQIIDLADCADILLLGTKKSLFETCALLHEAGLPSEEIENDF